MVFYGVSNAFTVDFDQHDARKRSYKIGFVSNSGADHERGPVASNYP
jgi:hypothetical protein